jgi:hypothetical protein
MLANWRTVQNRFCLEARGGDGRGKGGRRGWGKKWHNAYTTGGTGNQYKHFEKQYGDFLKN